MLEALPDLRSLSEVFTSLATLATALAGLVAAVATWRSSRRNGAAIKATQTQAYESLVALAETRAAVADTRAAIAVVHDCVDRHTARIEAALNIIDTSEVK